MLQKKKNLAKEHSAAPKIHRYILATAEKAAKKTSNNLPLNSIIAITDDKNGVATKLAKKLRLHHFKATVVTNIPTNSDCVISLTGLQKINHLETALSINKQIFNEARQIAKTFSDKGGRFITVQDTGGYFGLKNLSDTRAWLGGIAGLTKTALQEWPKVKGKAIDIEQYNCTPKIVADKIFNEIVNQQDDIEVGLPSNNSRIVLQLLKENEAQGKFNLPPKSVLVATGGARGITASCLIQLAKNIQLRIVLLGRTDLKKEADKYKSISDKKSLQQQIIKDLTANGKALEPKKVEKQLQEILAIREINNTINELEKSGVEVIYLTTDVQDINKLTHALDKARSKWGAIDGIIHGAGVLADKSIADKSDSQFDSVFDTKVNGLRNLLEATNSDNLKLIVLFSSVAGRFGNPGQADYAMANEILNKVAQAEHTKRGDSCLVKSINWGPWDVGMVNSSLRELFKQRGIHLISLQEGANLFTNELINADPDQVEVILGSKLVRKEKFKSKHTKNITELKQHVSITTHRYLNSHVIKESIVIPMCLSLEWLIRAAKIAGFNPLHSIFKNIQVIRGIRLDNFTEQSHYFTVIANIHHKNSHEAMVLELRDTEGVVRYSANAESELHSSPIKYELQQKGSWPWSINQIYDGNLLFHGQDFQVLKELIEFHDTGGAAFLSGIIDKQWPNENWLTDVAMLDGGLQLIRLWAGHYLKKLVLPNRMGEFRLYKSGVIPGTAQCIFQAKIKNKFQVISNLLFLDNDGNRIAEIQDLEFVASGEKIKQQDNASESDLGGSV
ncbi:MAG: SDR family NAD(P)-dependent oxidoreductase [Gammaproteobacteria bacterium]|nr:SDR family NAD(P)-dependent oxidoreductase [Gammaproteobacteria bacterium]